MNVKIRSLAREDIFRQNSYYRIEKEAERIAARFLESVQSAIKIISRMPDIGAPKMLKKSRTGGPSILACRRLSVHPHLLLSPR
jgi:plasmid stabilization system protein ParE